jgi:hypothetical protein
VPEPGPTATLPERALTPEDLVYSTIAEVFDDPDTAPFCAPIDGDHLALLTRGGGWAVSGPWRSLQRTSTGVTPDPEESWMVEAPNEWGHYGCCGRTERAGEYPDFDTALAAARAGVTTRHWMDT